MDLVKERELAIRKADELAKDTCANCKKTMDDGSSTMLECLEWCCDVEYDEVCDKHQTA